MRFREIKECAFTELRKDEPKTFWDELEDSIPDRPRQNFWDVLEATTEVTRK